MNQDCKHDDAFMSILKEEGQVMPFLDAIFGFLFRRTDFYIVQDDPAGKVGFFPGYAEQAVRDTFRKWQKLTLNTIQNNVSSGKGDFSDLVVQEEEVVTTDSSLEFSQDAIKQTEQKNGERDDLSSDIYNGADCEHYRWSQTALEVDIKIPVPNTVTNRNDVQVKVQASHLSVQVKDSDGQWSTLMGGQLSYKHHKDESIWTLQRGKQINVHLQKVDDRWWDRVLLTEPKLDTTKMDVTRHITDLPDEDKMQVEKVMMQEERKRLGLQPIGHQGKIDMLKKAWNQEGSPFQGTPFDPSVLHLSPD